MNATNMGFLLLAIWLITAGALALSGSSFPHSSTVMGVLAVLSGTLIIFGNFRSGRRWWSWS